MATKKIETKTQKVVSKNTNKDGASKRRAKQGAKRASPATTDAHPAAATAAAVVTSDPGQTTPVPPKGEGTRGRRGRKAAASARAANGDAAARTPLARDPRLPDPGTVLRKVDR